VPRGPDTSDAALTCTKVLFPQRKPARIIDTTLHGAPVIAGLAWGNPCNTAVCRASVFSFLP